MDKAQPSSGPVASEDFTCIFGSDVSWRGPKLGDELSGSWFIPHSATNIVRRATPIYRYLELVCLMIDVDEKFTPYASTSYSPIQFAVLFPDIRS